MCAPSVCSLVTTNDWFDLGRVAINVLSNEVLLDVFNFYVDRARERDGLRDMPYTALVHVCQ